MSNKQTARYVMLAMSGSSPKNQKWFLARRSASGTTYVVVAQFYSERDCALALEALLANYGS